jgi:hypothetical protein
LVSILLARRGALLAPDGAYRGADSSVFPAVELVAMRCVQRVPGIVMDREYRE